MLHQYMSSYLLDGRLRLGEATRLLRATRAARARERASAAGALESATSGTPRQCGGMTKKKTPMSDSGAPASATWNANCAPARTRERHMLKCTHTRTRMHGPRISVTHNEIRNPGTAEQQVHTYADAYARTSLQRRTRTQIHNGRWHKTVEIRPEGVWNSSEKIQGAHAPSPRTAVLTTLPRRHLSSRMTFCKSETHCCVPAATRCRHAVSPAYRSSPRTARSA